MLAEHANARTMSDNGAGSAGPALEADNLVVRYAASASPVISQQSIHIPKRQISALIGPNGSGKSTLLKTFAQHLTPDQGAVRLDGQQIDAMRPRDMARQLGILFQDHIAPAGITVEALIQHGRYPRLSFFSSFEHADYAAVDNAMALAGVESLRRRPVNKLSGGQKQLVWIAMALAQEPAILLLDEPTTFLDLRHQIKILQLVQRLRQERYMTLVLVLHDINQAARCADHLITMRDGQVVTAGPPHELINAALLRDVFGVESEIVYDSAGIPVCQPRLQ
jgi:iron complex transport system ATP-binding protein